MEMTGDPENHPGLKKAIERLNCASMALAVVSGGFDITKVIKSKAIGKSVAKSAAKGAEDAIEGGMHIAKNGIDRLGRLETEEAKELFIKELKSEFKKQADNIAEKIVGNVKTEMEKDVKQIFKEGKGYLEQTGKDLKEDFAKSNMKDKLVNLNERAKNFRSEMENKFANLTEFKGLSIDKATKQVGENIEKDKSIWKKVVKEITGKDFSKDLRTSLSENMEKRFNKELEQMMNKGTNKLSEDFSKNFSKNIEKDVGNKVTENMESKLFAGYFTKLSEVKGLGSMAASQMESARFRAILADIELQMTQNQNQFDFLSAVLELIKHQKERLAKQISEQNNEIQNCQNNMNDITNKQAALMFGVAQSM